MKIIYLIYKKTTTFAFIIFYIYEIEIRNKWETSHPLVLKTQILLRKVVLPVLWRSYFDVLVFFVKVDKRRVVEERLFLIIFHGTFPMVLFFYHYCLFAD